VSGAQRFVTSRTASRYLGLVLVAQTILACGSLISEIDRIEKKYTESNGANCADLEISDVAPVYAGQSNWMTYVKNDGTHPLNATGTPCTGSETGHFGSCLHAGEMRGVKISNRSSCVGISATDSLGAFYWRCVSQNGSVFVVTGGLAEEKYLSGLIDFTAIPTWKPNAVTVSDTCGKSKTTNRTQWYNNPIINNTTSVSATLSLTASNSVYAFTTDPGKPINIGGDKIAVVTAPGLTLAAPVGAGIYLSMGGNFQWLEANINAANATTSAIDLSGARFATLRGVQVANQRIELRTTRYCRLGHLRIFNGNLYFNGGTDNLGNLIHGLTISNGRLQQGFTSSSNNVFVGLTLLNADFGFSNGNGPVDDFNVVINHTGGNFDTAGLRGNTISDSTFMNVILANSASTAYRPKGVRNTIINMAVGASTAAIDASGSNDYFSGKLKLGGNTTDCTGSAAASGISNSCTPMGPSDFVVANTLNLGAAVFGRVLTDDTVNSSDSNGTAALASITDFFNFQNNFRAWGNENAIGGFAAGHRGACTTNCRIWDVTLLAADSTIRSTLPLPSGDDFFVHRWDATSSAACLAIRGAKWQDAVCSFPGYKDQTSCQTGGGAWATAAGNLCSSLVLRNAYEILDDALGNENGLCEANEACIYTPNIGSYQGHGTPVRIGSITSGTVAPVELWRYPSNGI
jgi:hypothetical protein